MKRVAFAVPGDLATPTGGYAYDRRMIAELQALGWQVDVIDLGGGFPRPGAEAKAAAGSKLAAAPERCPIVVDIGRAYEVLKSVLQPLNYRNLDELLEFKGKNTTTEFLAKYVFDNLASAARAGELGREGHELGAIRVRIAESHVARASYEAPLW